MDDWKNFEHECRCCETLPKTNGEFTSENRPNLPQKESLHRLQRSIFRWRWLLVSGRLTCLKWRIPASCVCCPQKVLGWNKHGCLIWIKANMTGGGMIYDVLLDKILVPWDGYNKHRTIRGIYVGTGLKTVSVNSQQGFLHSNKKISTHCYTV